MAWVLLAGLLGCEGCGGSDSVPPGQHTGGGSGGTTPAEGEETGESEPGPPPNLRVRGNARADGTVTIAVENHGARARVSGRLRLERGGGAFSEVANVRLDLRADCESQAPECIELIAGAALEPPDWLGTTGDAQCACEGCAAVEPGEYRFVATSCDGAHRVAGEPFRIDR